MKIRRFAIAGLSLFFVWACQHVEIKEDLEGRGGVESCNSKPFSIQLANGTPIFEDQKMPDGILMVDKVSVYVESIDQYGDVQGKIHISEGFASEKKEKTKVKVHCVSGGSQLESQGFIAEIPALKKLKLAHSQKEESELSSNNFWIRFREGKVEYRSDLPTEATGARNLHDFFSRVGVDYAFYELADGRVEFRGHQEKMGSRSYIAIQYNVLKTRN